MSDTWSALVIGPDAGLLGAPGHDWSSHPDYYERVKVVRADLVDAEIERLRAERDGYREDAERVREQRDRMVAAERQRARLPEKLVERIKQSSVGTECPTWARLLFRDILASIEEGDSQP